ncbi:replication initiator protein A [Oceanobacillus caeni]|uniref:replication initiator protein A n=1 Tax=Oceanobacillus caeni TaxID=405946 RepID=UPI00214A51EF|nr:replication initiator protein A [Oceanobacillus caeni]MCR1833168.1 replication initiator protein A [Oceanobacillus caeni]
MNGGSVLTQQSSYYNIYDEYGMKHFQLPKVFFTNSKYMEMSNDTKIAWSVLKDRHELSIKNGWYDDKGNIYFIYTNDELKEILKVGNTKLSNIKKELQNNGLLEQKRLGQGKPNRLYIKKPVVTEKDIYLIKKGEGLNPAASREVPKQDFKKSVNGISKNTKMGQLEILKWDGNDTDINKTDINDTEFNDYLYLNQLNEYIWKMKIPMPLKKFFSEKVKVLVTDTTFDISEIEYFYNTYTDYIQPDCAREDQLYLNDIEFTKTMKKMYSEVDRPIRNLEGLIKTWVQAAIHYKIENFRG